MKVFISGTKKEINIEGALKEKLDQLIAQGTDILIGDSMGVDKSVQEYLGSVGYKAVTVYSSGDRVQNNIGKWQEEHVEIRVHGYICSMSCLILTGNM